MTKILVGYTTNSGSTAEVAEAIGEELSRLGLEVDVRRLEETQDVAGYAGVVVGAPMIMGWHRGALKFLKRHREALKGMPLALFFTCMSLTQTGETQVGGVPLFLDPALPQEPKTPGRLTIKERYARVSNYLHGALQAAEPSLPVSAAFFGGKLEFFRLKFLQMLFVMIIIGAKPGDRRNWPAVRLWAADLAPLLIPEPARNTYDATPTL